MGRNRVEYARATGRVEPGRFCIVRAETSTGRVLAAESLGLGTARTMRWHSKACCDARIGHKDDLAVKNLDTVAMFRGCGKVRSRNRSWVEHRTA
jgi:hypothetical protein